MKAGAALITFPLLAATSASGQAADVKATPTMTDTKSEGFISGTADLMAHSTRTPILRWPHEYGMDYEKSFFPAMDGKSAVITLSGRWFVGGATLVE